MDNVRFCHSEGPTLEFQDPWQIAPPTPDQARQEERRELFVSSLMIKTSSFGEFDEKDAKDGCRTPTSLDQIIPTVPKCPPAPKKPKSLPTPKRKAASRLILLDLSSEVDSLFPQSLLGVRGKKIKRVRTVSCTE
ncbi:hypothetical protein NMG60_11034017 [Bertholletia excelsa]